MKYLILIAFLGATKISAEPVYLIDIGLKGGRISNSALIERIWKLEKAVVQLQSKVFELQVHKKPKNSSKKFTCHIESFGKVYSSTADTRTLALVQTKKACSKGSSSFSCEDKDIKCGN